ncbi:hypothetical protein A0H81_00663 [Grifola frondosa]|uniref:Tyr recombinase domain-containing protein n=1 Tax=Grifola frondosa TaxID=5627 RepID=A0A1C7MPA2_GRIFR|nr:hypothetical protein A0H81_00663 [Grifola frondosa]
MPALFSLPALAGAATYLAEAQSVSLDAVGDDHEEELESFQSAIEVERLQPGFNDLQLETQTDLSASQLRLPELSSKRQKCDHNELFENLKVASQGVVCVQTRQEYQRLWQQFTEFCAELQFVDDPEDIDKSFPNFPKELPTWIAVWIMNRCDEIDIRTGTAKGPKADRVTYNMGQKMRAAMTHKFARDFGLGTQLWTENPLLPGKFHGNPSLSVAVSQYMISLRRRKVRAGETVTSARAIDEPTMRALWEFNTNFEQSEAGPVSKKRKQEHPEQWAGYNVRVMLHALYLTSLLCLLRYDEALRVMWSDVHFDKNRDGIFRIAPFVLYPEPNKPWMCPIRAFAKWSDTCKQLGIPRSGYVFRKKIGNNMVSANPADAMSSEGFLECFRNNLLDVKIDPRPYDTHSFRRGGCQYLAMVLRWPFRNICSWGGWAPNFDNPGTLFKYLLSWTDTPLVEREDYFNPNRAGTDPCNACGRTCHCG